MQPPDVLSKEGMFSEQPGIMWKKCLRDDGNEVVLMMEATKIKSGLIAHELIADEVKVLAIYDMWGYKTSFRHANSPSVKGFVYEVGKTVAGPIWGYARFEMAQRKWVGMYGASKDSRYEELATAGGRKIL